MTKTLAQSKAKTFGVVHRFSQQSLSSHHDSGCLTWRCPWAWIEIEITTRQAKLDQCEVWFGQETFGWKGCRFVAWTLNIPGAWNSPWFCIDSILVLPGVVQLFLSKPWQILATPGRRKPGGTAIKGPGPAPFLQQPCNILKKPYQWACPGQFAFSDACIAFGMLVYDA